MVQASDTSAQPTFSLPNGSYTWQVVAFDRAGAQRISNQNWTVVVNLLPPAVPTLLSPLNGSINLFTSLTLSWNASTGADIYHLQVATDSNFATIIRNDSTLLSTSSPVGPLANAATYYWRVRAKNFAGASAYFLVWDFRTIPTLPSQLLLIFPAHAAVINADSVILVWGRGQPEVDRYWLQIASDSLFTNNVLTDSTLIDTSYVARQLVNNQTNWWRVKAHNVAGWGSFGSAYKFTAIITEVGTPENLPDHFALHQNYPNPFNPSTSIIYDVPTTSHIRLTIFDLLGREIVVLVDGIQQPGRLEVVFTATNLASGIYLYRIETATFRDTKKLVLLR
jgi:hypothetical protein